MPPTSRGVLLLRVVRRHVSTSIPSKPTGRPDSVKFAPKPKTPPQPSHPRSLGRQPKSEKPEAAQPSPQSEQPPPNVLVRFLRHPRYASYRRTIFLIPVIALGLLHSPYELLSTNGQSMSPFLNPESSQGIVKERLLVQRWFFSQSSRGDNNNNNGSEASKAESQRGQIVVFDAPHAPEKVAVKRIVAVAGDVVQPLEGYPGGDDPVVVPWNHVWVEGDIGVRKDSMDSNWFGPISQNLIIGEVKAVLTSWVNWTWLDWRQHTWPAQRSGRVEENAITQAMVDPDAVDYSNGWRNGAIALVLERMKRQPEQSLFAFVNEPKTRQEIRRLYNNALYVREVATSEQERELADEVMENMEELYGREALVFGLRMRRKTRDRGEEPDVGNSKLGDKVLKDQSASDAERWLKKQGWQLEKDSEGAVKTRSPS